MREKGAQWLVTLGLVHHWARRQVSPTSLAFGESSSSGHPRDFFGHFWTNFGHFLAILGPFFDPRKIGFLPILDQKNPRNSRVGESARRPDPPPTLPLRSPKWGTPQKKHDF